MYDLDYYGYGWQIECEHCQDKGCEWCPHVLDFLYDEHEPRDEWDYYGEWDILERLEHHGRLLLSHLTRAPEDWENLLTGLSGREALDRIFEAIKRARRLVWENLLTGLSGREEVAF